MVGRGRIPKTPKKKRKKTARPKSTTRARRCLYDELMDEDEYAARDILVRNALPFIKTMKKHGTLETFCSFVVSVVDGIFPMDNIAWHLFLDVVRFISTPNNSGFRYTNPATLLFWTYGTWLFHGKFTRFMSGPKYQGLITLDETTRGVYRPEDAKINFIVPSYHTLNNNNEIFVQLRKDLLPGVIVPLLDTFVSKWSHTQFVLSLDGKLLRQGLTKEGGDIDMGGIENGPLLSETKNLLKEEIDEVDLALEDIDDTDETIDLTHIELNTGLLAPIVQKLSSRIREVRLKKLSTEIRLRGILKNKVEDGEDWRKSRFAMVISRLQCEVSEQGAFLQRSLQNIRKLCICARQALGKPTPNSLLLQNTVNLHNFAYELVEYENLSAEYQQNSFFVKQRSEAWFEIRKTAPVTGSTLNQGLGLSTLKEQKQFFLRKKNEKNGIVEQVDEVLQERFRWGTEREKHAVATLTTYVLPLFFPKAAFFEVGCSAVRNEADDRNLIMVSPDGILSSPGTSDGAPWTVDHKVEIKCPMTPGVDAYNTAVYYKIPRYYVPQILSEMAAPPVCQSCIFVCFSTESTVIFAIEFDNELWKAIRAETEMIFPDEPLNSIPTKRSHNVRNVIPNMIQKFINDNVTILAEVPSVFVDDTSVPFDENRQLWGPYYCPIDPLNENIWRSDVLRNSLLETKSLFQRAFEIMRRPANELFVSMLSTIDRKHNADIPSTVPIFFGFRQKSFSQEEKWKLYHLIMNAMSARNVSPICVVFDGEWASFLSRSESGKALTLVELQRQLYKRVSKMKKSEIISKLDHFLKEHHKKMVIDKPCGVKSTNTRFMESNSCEWQQSLHPSRDGSQAIELIDNHMIDEFFEIDIVIEPETVKRRKSRKKLKQLSQLAKEELKKKSFPKKALVNAYAKIIWQKELQEWKSKSTVKHGLGAPFPNLWFSIPEFSPQRKQLEFKCWDGTHLLTNLRSRVCENGMDRLKAQAWHEVARRGTTLLTVAMAIDLVDKQDIEFAKVTFCPDVEREMRKLGYTEEADFCQLAYNWFRAEDEPGLDSKTRAAFRLKLREYLLKDVEFGMFPPFGTNVHGFPIKLYEGFLSSIDTHLQLYGVTKSYNQRTVTTLNVENFFSTLGELDTAGTGHLSAVDAQRAVGTACGLQMISMKPNKSFWCATTIKRVYASVTEEVGNLPNDDDRNSKTSRISYIEDITIENHDFDKEERGRLKRRQKTQTTSDFRAPAKGALPVRQYHRVDESKILPEKRFQKYPEEGQDA